MKQPRLNIRNTLQTLHILGMLSRVSFIKLRERHLFEINSSIFVIHTNFSFASTEKLICLKKLCFFHSRKTCHLIFATGGLQWSRLLHFFCSNPNEGPHTVDVEWPEYDPTTSNYLQIGEYPQPKEMIHETDRMDKFIYFSEIWPTLIQPRGSSYDIRDIGMYSCIIAIFKIELFYDKTQN